MRYGRQGHALVAFAGPASNIVIALLVAVPMRIVLGSPGLARTVVENPLLFWLPRSPKARTRVLLALGLWLLIYSGLTALCLQRI